MTDRPASLPAPPGPGAGRRLHVLVSALIPLLLLLAGSFHYVTMRRSLDRDTLSRRQAVARLGSSVLKERLDRVMDIGISLAGRVQFRRLIAQDRWQEAMPILGQVPRDFPFIERLLIADTGGRLRADLPYVVSVQGSDFSGRDWYRGVTRSWRPYLSEAYRRAAEPRHNVVAAAIPLTSEDGRRIGILVLQVGLSTLVEWTKAAGIGPSGFIYVVDHRGRVVAHPRFAPNQDIPDFSGVPAVSSLLRGKGGLSVSYDPPDGEPLLSAYEAVPVYGWGVVVAEPVATAFAARNRQLRGLFAVYAVLLASGIWLTYARLRSETRTRSSLEQQLYHSQKMEAVGRLAGGIAHDFNNLLMAILGNCSFLLERLGPREPGRQEVEEIQSAGERAAGLTRQLLAFSRRQVFQNKVLDLNAVVAEMESLLRRLIGEDIELVTVLRPGLGRVMADQGQLEQVLMNLVVNARDAMPRGGRLVIESADAVLDSSQATRRFDVRPGPYVCVAVSDTGVGMDPATQEKLFEPFFTTKALGKGTGLGLSTAYGIVKQSDGYIWVYSEPGKGSTFKIFLPRVEEAAQTPAASQAVSTLKGTETILLVEDEEKVRQVVSRALTRRGYNLIEAKDGDEALEACRREGRTVRLLITDVVLPGMSGPELAGRVEALCPGIRTLYVSGYTENTAAIQEILAKGAGFLQKPFAPDVLSRKIRELLDPRTS